MADGWYVRRLKKKREREIAEEMDWQAELSYLAFLHVIQLVRVYKYLYTNDELNQFTSSASMWHTQGQSNITEITT